MAKDATQVRVAVTGAVSVGLTTAAAPTTASGAVTGFSDLGYVDDGGVTESRNRTVSQLKAWQNADTVRSVVTDAEMTYKFNLVQTNPATVALFYNTTVTQTLTMGSVIIVPSAQAAPQSFVIDVIDGSHFIRAYIPNGQVTDVGDQVYASGVPVGYEVTITCYPSSTLVDGAGNLGSVEKFFSDLHS